MQYYIFVIRSEKLTGNLLSHTLHYNHKIILLNYVIIHYIRKKIQSPLKDKKKATLLPPDAKDITIA
mgnify:CR=1 FL=1